MSANAAILAAIAAGMPAQPSGRPEKRMPKGREADELRSLVAKVRGPGALSQRRPQAKVEDAILAANEKRARKAAKRLREVGR